MGRAEGDGAQHEAPVLERHTTRFRAGRQPGPLTAPVLGRSGCLSRPQSKEAAVSTRGRLLHATTDWRILCRPISSIPAVRQLSAGKGVGRNSPSSGSPQGAEGGRWKTSTATAACIERARRAGEGAASRVVRSCAQGRRPTRGGESARTRWSCGGARPPNFQDRRCTGLFEQQVPVKSVFAQTR